MTREERIARYEQSLDRVNAAARALEDALDGYEGVRADLRALEAYYTGPEWRADYEADEAGRIPADLKRGVLSQDGIDGALERFRGLEERLRALSSGEGERKGE